MKTQPILRVWLTAKPVTPRDNALIPPLLQSDASAHPTMHASAFPGDGVLTPTRVQAYAGRTLDLLQAIEKTVDFLTDNCDLLQAMSTGMGKQLEALQSSNIAQCIDPEGRVRELLTQSMDAVERLHAAGARRREAAAADRRLRKEDGVVDAFDNFLRTVDAFHSVLHELVEWIETHDALLDAPSGGAYESVDALFDAMGVPRE